MLASLTSWHGWGWNGWEACVAFGTLALAGATFFLGWQARGEARAVRDEAVAVTDQIGLQRLQLKAAIRPVVFPTAPANWVATGSTTDFRITNGGPGPALSVGGMLFWQGKSGQAPIQLPFYIGSIASGATETARISQGVGPGFGNSVGFVRYTDLEGIAWATDFRFRVAIGGTLYVESDSPYDVDDEGEPAEHFPPMEWPTE